MNVFEHLGLPANHRTGKFITQHVKNFDEVPDSKKAWPLFAQIKKDGVYALVVKTSHGTKIFSRTGKHYTNIDNLEKKIDDYEHGHVHGMDNAVYIAELCNTCCSLEKLSGMVNPNRKKELDEKQGYLMKHTYLEYHDTLSLEAFKDGYSFVPYVERHFCLRCDLPSEFVALGLQVVNTEEEARSYAREAIADGEEGIVLKQYATGLSDWEAGHKGYRMMKIVRGVDYDLLCTGVEEGTGKYEVKLANLLFRWKDGKTVKCMLGKGWTHDMAEEMWNAYIDFDAPIGMTFQVYALQESSKGLLRLPKVGEARHDKDEPDI
jgi:hypothetical protein